MAKETKAERQAREALQHAQYLEDQKLNYPTRLMYMLERAQDANFELKVKDAGFELHDRDARFDARYAKTFYVNLQYSEDANEVLDTLEVDVASKEEATKEANRKFLATQVALAKLSKEEKELLGLA